MKLCTLLTAALTGFAPLGAAAQDVGPTTQVAVFGDRYAWEGLAFDDLDAVEEAVWPRHFALITLVPCGGGIERPLLALVHRFRERRLELRPPDSAVACSAAAAARPVRVAAHEGPRPGGIDDAAVAHWWRQISP